MSADSDALAAKAEDALEGLRGAYQMTPEAEALVGIAWALLALYERLGPILYVRDADRV